MICVHKYKTFYMFLTHFFLEFVNALGEPGDDYDENDEDEEDIYSQMDT